MSSSPKKQSKVEFDIEGFENGLSIYNAEVEPYKNTAILICDRETLDETIRNVRKVKDTAVKLNGLFEPVKESMKKAEKAMKTAVETLTKPLAKYEEEARSEITKFMTENRDIKSDLGRMQNGQWGLEVKDEDALMQSLVSVQRKKNPETGKMEEKVVFDPRFKALFKYQPAQGNALAKAMGSACNLPGCVAKQSEHFTLSGEE